MSSKEIKLLNIQGNIENYTIKNEPLIFEKKTEVSFNRVAFSSAHVVANPNFDYAPSLDVCIDWNKTLSYRNYLWDLGLGVAEGMDTAQRGMGLDWNNSLELIRQSVKLAKSRNDKPLIFSGVGTDHIIQFSDHQSIQNVIEAYLKQIEEVEKIGGRIILMASRLLASIAKSNEDYQYVYSNVLSQISQPVIIHWLGDMFDPNLKGYWGSSDIDLAMKNCLDIIFENREKIDGIKISLLDANREKQMRKKLPSEIKMYTGDDFNYPELIAGDGENYSHALLGIFDAIAPLTSFALQELAQGNEENYFRVLNPTINLSRHIFQNPTRFYKTGIVFMAYLNGHQDHFQMVGGQQSFRSIIHFCTLFKLADQARALRNPDLAIQRMLSFLDLNLGLK